MKKITSLKGQKTKPVSMQKYDGLAFGTSKVPGGLAKVPYIEQAQSAMRNQQGKSLEQVLAVSKTLWETPINDKGFHIEGSEVFLHYMVKLRSFSHEVSTEDGSITVDNGEGRRREFIYRMLWLVIYQRPTFWANLETFLLIGSIRDWFELWRLLLEYRNNSRGMYISNSEMAKKTVELLNNNTFHDFVLKYMPTIKTYKACNTLHTQANNIIANSIAKELFVIDGFVVDGDERLPLTIDGAINNSARAKLQKLYRVLKRQSKGNEAQRVVSSLASKDDPEKTTKDSESLKVLEDNIEIPGRLRYIWTHNKFASKHGLNLTKSTSLLKLACTFEDGHTPSDKEREQFNKLLRVNINNLPKMLVCVDVSSRGENILGAEFYTIACLYASIINDGMKNTTLYNNLITFTNGVYPNPLSGDNILDNFIEALCLNIKDESINEASVEKLAAFIKLMVSSGLEVPYKFLIITNNDNLEINDKVFKNFIKLVDMPKEYISKLEIITWHPNRNLPNKHIEGLFEVNGMDKDLMAYITGHAPSFSKSNIYDKLIVIPNEKPVKKATAAKKSNNNKKNGRA